MKKILSLLLIVVLLFGFSASTFANDTNSANHNSFDKYANEIIPKHLGVFKNIDLSSPIYISKSLKLKNLNNNTSKSRMYFLLSNDNVIGKLLVTKNKTGGFASTFDTSSLQEFNKLYTSKKKISLINVDGQLIAQNNEANILIEDFYKSNSVKNIKIQENSTKTTIEKNKLINLPSYASSSFSSLSIPHKANASINGGICWAAVCASIIEYKKGDSLTATELFNEVWNDYGGTPTTMPSGTWTHMKHTYNMHQMYPDQVYALTDDEVSNLLGNDTPIHMGMYDYSDPNHTVGHSVALRGNSYAGGTLIYSLMDPNKSSYVSISVPSDAQSNGRDLVYHASYGYDFEWKYARY